MNDLEFQKTNAGRGFGIAGMVLGIGAFFLALIPLIGTLALIPAGLGLVLSIIGLIQAYQANGRKALLFTAMGLSILSCLIVGIYIAFFAVAIQDEKVQETYKIVKEGVETIIEKKLDSINVDSITQKELERVLEEFEEEVHVEIEESDSSTTITIKKNQ